MKIGFIDHHLNNYHANKFHSLLSGSVGQGKVQVAAAYESAPQGADDWCAARGVERASTPQEVADKSDALIVLAPDNIAEHLALGQAAYESGKPVLVDKCLATSLSDAKQILEIARGRKTPVMSSSSLRFSVELEEMVKKLPENAAIETVFSRGFGSWRGYGVHCIAPALRLFGAGVKRLADTGANGVRLVTLDDGKRRALLEVREAENQFEAFPWVIGIQTEGRIETATIKLFDEFYENLMKQTLAFFESGVSPISPEEMLMTVAVEEAADQSQQKGGEWVSISL